MNEICLNTILELFCFVLFLESGKMDWVLESLFNRCQFPVLQNTYYTPMIFNIKA